MTLAAQFEALIPRLETPRLILRGFRPADFEPYAAYCASERSRFTGGPMDRNLAWRAFCHMTGHWVHRGYGFFVIEDKTTGLALGTAGAFMPEGWPAEELGWTLWSQAGEGKGYALEAALAARGYIYDTLGWPGVISMILKGNTKSEALAQRMGCVRDGEFTHAQLGETSIWRHPAPSDLPDGGMEAYA